MVLKVEGMMCENCIRHVTEAVLEAGALSCEVSLEEGTVTVEPGEAMLEELTEAILDAGYEVVEE